MSDFITLQVIKRLRDHLEAKMMVEIPVDDPTRADLVKIGRFQDNPKKKNIHLSISGGSQNDPELIDGILTMRDHDRIGFRMDSREIGRGQFWWRRGEVRIGCFFVNTRIDEVLAAEYAYKVYERTLANIENVQLGSLVDEHGERAIEMFCFAASFMESGGDGHFIWRGSAKWQFLSERPYR